jgi:hypothetical protein
MTALLGPTSRMRKGNRWRLVAHTVALFSVETIGFAYSLCLLSAGYINNREFPAGPLVHAVPRRDHPELVVIASIINSTIPVNQWLVDGLLVSPVLNTAT